MSIALPLELIITIISSIIGAIGIMLWQKGAYLNKHGKRSRAVVFSNDYRSDSDGTGCYYPTVRFLTDQQVWITKELNVGFKPAIKEGTKLDVVYDPEEPTDVHINSAYYLIILPRIMVVISLCGLIFGILEAFDVISFID